MPHLFADFAFPFIRKGWEMNDRGALIYDYDAAVANGAIPAEDVALLGQPTALHSGSVIKPEGENWSTARYLRIYNYAASTEAAETIGRYVSAGVPAGGVDRSELLDAELGPALASSVQTDLTGTPEEQIFSFFASGNWLLHYNSLTPQTTAAGSPLLRANTLVSQPVSAISTGVSAEAAALLAGSLLTCKPAELSLTAQLIADEMGEESKQIFRAALSFDIVGILISLAKARDMATWKRSCRRLLRRILSSFAVQPELNRTTLSITGACTFHTNRLPLPDSSSNGSMTSRCAFSPLTAAFRIRTSTFTTWPSTSPDGAAAQAHLQSMPTPAQEEARAARGQVFQPDPDTSSDEVIRSFILWQPPGETSVIPGYGQYRRNNQVVIALNIFYAGDPVPGLTAIDPVHQLYQDLRSGLLNIHEQRVNAAAERNGWPTYEVPEVFSG